VGQFNRQLEEFERATSSQIVVAVFPKLNTSSSMEDFTQRIATSWQVGQKDKNNGAVLFIFLAEHKMRIEVGYGLEGVLPDAICKRIISDEIAPRFRQANYAAGLGAGINAMIAAAKGEYKGTGRTVANRRSKPLGNNLFTYLIILIVVISIIRFLFRLGRGAIFSGRGYRRSGWSSWGSGGGSWGGGGGGGFSGGGFSGGGGSFGGGGASGGW